MPDQSVSETTQLLRAWADGDGQALRRLVPRVYRELRNLANRVLQHQIPGQAMQATDLVHEVYLKLVDVDGLNWQHRAHFFGVAATMMRRIMIDDARRRMASKRGGGFTMVTLVEGEEPSVDRSRQIVALDDALNVLAELDPRKARIVELRFFVGLDVRETAAVVAVSPETVMRDWKTAREWLLQEMRR